MDTNQIDRRKFTRIDMRAYAQDHSCILSKGQKRCQVLLIDISPGGARFKLPDPMVIVPFARGDKVVIDTGLKSAFKRYDGIECNVRWVGQIDFGVQFVPELDLTAGDLQRLLDS